MLLLLLDVWYGTENNITTYGYSIITTYYDSDGQKQFRSVWYGNVAHVHVHVRPVTALSGVIHVAVSDFPFIPVLFVINCNVSLFSIYLFPCIIDAAISMIHAILALFLSLLIASSPSLHHSSISFGFLSRG